MAHEDRREQDSAVIGSAAWDARETADVAPARAGDLVLVHPGLGADAMNS